MTDDQQDELRDTAYHEACHYVMGRLAKGGLPRHISIVAGEEFAGSIDGSPTLPGYDVLFALAGVFAEEVFNSGDTERAAGDMRAAEDALRAVHGAGWEPHFERYLEFVYRLLGYYIGPRRAIGAAANYLLEHPQLTMEEVYPLDDLVKLAIGRRQKWLCVQVDAFISEVLS